MQAAERTHKRHWMMLAISLVAVLALLTACSSPAGDDGGDAGGADVATDDGAADPSEDDAGGDDGGGSATASITLTLSGGSPHDGTHEAEAPDAGCSRNLSGENTFGLQYSTSENAGFTSHQMIVRDATGAASGSDDFKTDVTVDGATYGIDTGAGVMNDPSGSGTVTVDDRGDTATITIVGETAEGFGLEATIECHRVTG